MTQVPKTRHEAEHALAALVARWVEEREEKSAAMKAHNDIIKNLEEEIEKISAQLVSGLFQPSLPFSGPRITAVEDEGYGSESSS